MWEDLFEFVFAFLKKVIPGIIWDKIQGRMYELEKQKLEAELKGKYEKNKSDVLSTANESDAVAEVLDGKRADSSTEKKPL